MSEAITNIVVEALVFLPVILVTWLATKRHKAADLKTNFPNPRREALLSIAVVLSIAVILTVFIFSLYQRAGGPIGTPTQFYPNGALSQWVIYGVLFIFPVFAVIRMRHQELNSGHYKEKCLVLNRIKHCFGIRIGSVHYSHHE